MEILYFQMNRQIEIYNLDIVPSIPYRSSLHS